MFNNLIMAKWFDKMITFILGFFAIIPQLMYFIYASAASFLDFLQYLVRKVAGLDVYYIEGEEVSGDIVTSFIRGILGIDKNPTYSAISTVFWSMVIFGAILLILTTIFAIIKAHYNYDAKKSHPMTILFETIKTFSLMAIVPIVVIFGLTVCNVLLQSLDKLTSSSSANISVFDNMQADGTVTNNMSSKFDSGEYGDGPGDREESDSQECYTRYDFFGYGGFTSTTTFSGVLFNAAANGANRVRLEQYRVPDGPENSTGFDNFDVFYSNSNNEDDKREIVAQQIDYAFANNLRLKDHNTVMVNLEDDWVLNSSLSVSYGGIIRTGLIEVPTFSKFNVGLVWYFYDLWAFNWIIAWAGFFTLIAVLSNIVFGLIVRLIQMLALFIVFPPLIGLAPLDEGNAFKQWKKQYLSDALMAFGAIVGLNIFFVILPFFNSISFFNVRILDMIMNIVIMVAGLTMVKNFIAMLSGFIGGGDANKTGEQTKKAVGDFAMKAGNMVLKTTMPGVKAQKLITTGVGRMGATFANKTGATKLVNNIMNRSAKAQFENNLNDDQKEKLEEYKKTYGNAQGTQKFMADPNNDLTQEQKGTKAFIKHSEKTDKKVNRLEKASKVAQFFGADAVKGPDKDQNGNKEIVYGKTLKGFGQSVIDVGKDSVKLVGMDALGGGALKKSLGASGMTDTFGKVLKTAGVDTSGMKTFSDTDKAKEDTEKEAKKEERASQISSANSLNEIKTLMNELNKKIPSSND